MSRYYLKMNQEAPMEISHEQYLMYQFRMGYRRTTEDPPATGTFFEKIDLKKNLVQVWEDEFDGTAA